MCVEAFCNSALSVFCSERGVQISLSSVKTRVRLGLALHQGMIDVSHASGVARG